MYSGEKFAMAIFVVFSLFWTIVCSGVKSAMTIFAVFFSLLNHSVLRRKICFFLGPRSVFWRLRGDPGGDHSPDPKTIYTAESW